MDKLSHIALSHLRGAADHQLHSSAMEAGSSDVAPPISHVITSLLLTRAINAAGLSADDLGRIIRMPAPIIAIRSKIEDLESHVIRLLEETTIAGGRRWLTVDARITFDNDWPEDEPQDGRRLLVYFDHHCCARLDADAMSRRMVNTLSRELPMLFTIGQSEDPPVQLVLGSDLKLSVEAVDVDFIETVLEAVYGRDALKAFGNLPETFRPQYLTFGDLLLSIRPNRSLSEVVHVLVGLAAKNMQAARDSDDDDTSEDALIDDFSSNGEPDMEKRKKPPSKQNASTSKWRDKPSGAEVIQPDEMDSNGLSIKTGKVPVMLETLSGYGRAKDWALDLKSDLLEYLTDDLAWAEMSTKLLLSGPPGTGKTTYAKALCNSLQVPLVVTSVSTWLEGGHLNDVIHKMSKTFEEARALSPSILFIDEIDGIGKRQPAERDYSDYWNTVVNKSLELLDGAVKAEGVIIVGATNRPDAIDEALKRSGRLETHIEIPRPDIATLTGIIAHHLGEDATRIAEAANAGHSNKPANDDAALAGDNGRTGNE